MDSKAKLKRELILKSATDFVLNNDFNDLTLDSIAKQAGISKGGLLYHFPNKEALYQGLAEYIFNDFIRRFDDYAKKDSMKKGKWNRALIHASIWDIENHGVLNIGNFSASLLNPELAKNISNQYQYIQNRIVQDEISPVTATIIRLTLDGLYYSKLFNIAPIDKSLSRQVSNHLLAMTK
ncbi:TetR family transcriptional regulator [Bacillus mycoides]|uniref:TetR/AcrR family transcriptional regulator n=1 Tax=Bacillus cereus group TaxID=86661 RepID=UPI0027F16AD2|nr:TetR family transcriptional regulator [Bacillus cereus]HDT6579819.1 TetR family transcriptional regulator [Bacillus cereus]